ncbi:MAG TPA: MMPL family transporter [Thermoleophilaceae bacterium]
MFTSLWRRAVRRPRRVAALAFVAFLLAAVIGGPATGSFEAPHAFDDPGSQGTQAREQIERATGDSSSDVLALVHAPPGSPAVARTASVLRADPDVTRVTVPSPRAPSPLVSRDRGETLIAANVRASARDEDLVKRLEKSLRGDRSVSLGGDAVANTQAGEQATSDLGRAELFAFPLLALLSLLVFRGVAAALPLAVGSLSVLSTFALLRGVNEAVALSPFALNLVIGLGLGLAVDYSLLFVSRFREELGHGSDVSQAVRRTLATAGRTVVFSAVTVAAAAASLTVFPQRFLISMGIGGVIVALVAAAATVLVLPGLLVLLGARIGKVQLGPDRSGRWYGLAQRTMRRPALVATAAAAMLIALAAPAVSLNWTGVDASILPTSKSARVVQDSVTRDFPQADASPVNVVLNAPTSDGASVRAYSAQLKGVQGVRSVSTPRPLDARTWEIDLHTGSDAASGNSQRVVSDVRALRAPAPVLVGGTAADLHDQRAAVSHAVPIALGLLAVLTIAALWLMTGSLVLPAIALVMNLLTVAAATGILVFVFQQGHLAGLIGTSAQPGIEQTDYLVLLAIVFGLSTDYGVFLLSRIKEARDRGLSDQEAIAVGVQRTGAIVSAAAILLTVALGAFVTGKVVFLKELGLGAAVAVLLDAFVVRTLLVPSLLRILGPAAWWSPGPLRRLHGRIGVAEPASA